MFSVPDWVAGHAEGRERERQAREKGSTNYNIGYQTPEKSEQDHIRGALAERAFAKLTGLPLPSRTVYDGSRWDFRGPSGVLVNVKGGDRVDRGLSCTPERLPQRWHPTVEVAVKIAILPGCWVFVGWMDRKTFIERHRIWQGSDYRLMIVDAEDLWDYPKLATKLGLK